MPWRRHVDGTRTSRQFQRETWTILGKKKEKLNVQVCPPFLPPSSLCRASSDIISSSQIRSILFTLPLFLSLSISLSLFLSLLIHSKIFFTKFRRKNGYVVNAVLLAFSSYLCHRAYILPSNFHRLSDRAGKWRVRQLSASSLWSTRVTPNPVAENVNFSHQDPKCIPCRNIIFTARIRFQREIEITPRENSFSKLRYFKLQLFQRAYLQFGNV